MKRLIFLLLVPAVLFSITGCAEKEETVIQDDSPVTISVSLGNNDVYFNALKNAIKDNLGYDVRFIYQNAIDTTNAVRLEFRSNDLPADIMSTASKTSEEYLKDSALDLMGYTHLSDYFTYDKLEEVTNSDGTVYQLPFTSRLIGITYNKTLMDEMGWEVPDCFDDMLDLKSKCEEAGIPFSVSAGAATGHGFNYLFHLMGAQWLSTLEGTQWLNGFLAGDADVSEFKEQARYFEEWVTNGLFGELHDEDWNAADEYCRTRALFFFDLTSSTYTYEGDIIDSDGSVTGQVSDEFKSIPWLSRDGGNNCYTYYDCMYLSLNRKLAEPDQADRLKKCIEILEFMTTEPVTDIFKNTFQDGYVAVNEFSIDYTRNYCGYREKIEEGYLMPWYYSYFNNDTIVSTGQLVNNYIKDGSSSFNDIFDQLQTSRDAYLNHEVKHVCDISETLTYEDVAKLNYIGAVRAYRETLYEKCIPESAALALIPYVDNPEELVPFSTTGTVSTKAYAGEMVENDVRTIIPAKGEHVVGIHIKGSELKELIDAGLSDGNSVYRYVDFDTDRLKDDEVYLTVVSKANLNEELYDRYMAEGLVLMNGDEPLDVSILSGVSSFLLEHETISSADLKI